VLFDGLEENSGGLSWSDLLKRTASSAELGAGGKILRDNLPRFEQAVSLALAANTGDEDDLIRVRQAGLDSIEDLGISAEAGESLRTSWNLLDDSLPPGTWVPLDETSSLVLWRHSVARAVRRARQTFRIEVADTVSRASELVRLERSREAEQGGGAGWKDELGGEADGLIDPTRLAAIAGPRRGSVRRSAERLQTLSESLELLEAYLAGDEGPEAAIVLLPDAPLPHGWTEDQTELLVVHNEDPCACAMELFDRETAAWSEVLRARKHVDLELSGRFDPRRHSAWLEGAPPALTPEAQSLLPPVAAVENPGHLGRDRLASLSHVLRGRRPVHVIVTLDPYDDPGARTEDTPSAHNSRLELAYLAIGHRRAAAHQGVLSQPLDLVRAFDRLADRPEPALHLIATSTPDATPGPWLHLGAAVEGRAHPLFTYDPIAGESWARRLELGNNPQPEADWPIYPEADDETFTFADFALLDPRARTEFRQISEGLEAADFVPLVKHLTQHEGTETEIPYIRAIDESGTPTRLAVSAHLVRASKDRLDFWRTLQELAGIGNEHVRRAIDSTREEMTTAWEEERRQLEELQAAAVAEASESAGNIALEGVARFLLDLDPGSLDGIGQSLTSGAQVAGVSTPSSDGSTNSAAPVAAPGSDDNAGATIAEAAEVETAPPPSAGDDDEMEPYVDTVLCTSCDDCVRMNPRLFVYDSNKQVEIIDPTAGTYKHLVEAAEKCPAKCIHPGTPLDPNEPGLDGLRQRAAAFN
jgi:ferredoxin